MAKRIYNFCAGPCTLPLEVLEEVQQEFVDYKGSGMSLIEMSHRGEAYEAVHNEAMALATEVFEAPPEFEVLFLQGGATLQFGMVPMNLLTEGQQAAYICSGAWAKQAINDAKSCGLTYIAWDGGEEGYTRMPTTEEIELRPGTRYLHITSNETIEGIRYSEWPDVDIPLVADVSSEYMARPIPWEHFDLIYGGAQKNLGPAGVAVVFVRQSSLAGMNEELPTYLRYPVHAEKRSLRNTPPMFQIYVLGKVLKWIKRKGGLRAVEQEAEHKAGLLYKLIESSGGYYSTPVVERDRSRMNVVFRLPSEELEAKFLEEAEEAGLVSLKGHRSVGGCRASLYHAMPVEGVVRLTEFMEDFRRRHPA